jgi:hypothetical protein
MERLLNVSGHWHPRMDDFYCEVANKELTTIRIPPLVFHNGWSFPPGTPVSSTNKTDRHDKTEILLKVALNITTP